MTWGAAWQKRGSKSIPPPNCVLVADGHTPVSSKPPFRVPVAGKIQSGSSAMDHLFA